MNLKRIATAALALAMTASLSTALAAELPAGWTPADGARVVVDDDVIQDVNGVLGDVMLISAPLDQPLMAMPTPEVVTTPVSGSYRTWLYLNGEQLDASAIPGVSGQLLPMRLLCEADGGMAEWYPDDNEGYFYLADSSITVSFADNSVMVNFQPVEGVTATVLNGVTFLPAELVNTLEGVEVDLNLALDVDRIDVTTPNGTPLMKMANAIMEVANMGRGMKTTPADMEEAYGEALGFKAEYMTEGVVYLPMMISPDTLVLGKAADGKLEELQESLEAFRKNQEDIFTTYLSQNLPKIQNAKFVTSGDWFLFLIAENADEAVTLFEAMEK